MTADRSRLSTVGTVGPTAVPTSPAGCIHSTVADSCAVLPPQACSILYKTKLPLILVFNKTDITNHEFAVDWMKVNTSILYPATLTPEHSAPLW